MNDLKKTVGEMLRMGELLIPHTYPASSLEEEKTIKILKQRELVVDGYDVVVSYSKADYKNHYLEILQIQGLYVPFLPFNLICKLGRLFLGSDCLSIIEIMKSNNKLYCWTLYKNKDGSCIVPPETESKKCSFEGFEFSSLNPDAVNFY